MLPVIYCTVNVLPVLYYTVNVLPLLQCIVKVLRKKKTICVRLVTAVIDLGRP